MNYDAAAIRVYEKAKEEISDRLRGKTGEPVIFQFHIQQIREMIDFGDRTFIGGFLEGETLTTDEEARLIIPTGDYIFNGHSIFSIRNLITTRKPRVGDPMHLCKGPLGIHIYDIQHWNAPGFGMESYSLMAVGLDEVRLALSGGRINFRSYLENPGTMEHLLASIKNPFDDRLALLYEMLEKEMPASLSIEKRKKYERKRREILWGLDESLGTLLELNGDMEKVRAGAISVQALRTEDWGQAGPCASSGSYDTDDAIIRNLGRGEKANDEKRKITRMLQEALDSKIEKDSEEVTMGFPGRYIKPSEFIGHLCQLFKVE